MIQFKCSSCGKAYSVPADKAGVRAKCKQCGAVMEVPRPATTEGDYELDAPAPAPAKPAATTRPATKVPAPARQAAAKAPALTPRPAATSSKPPADAPAPAKAATGPVEPALGRPFKPAVEAKRRKAVALAIGILMVMSWLAPTLRAAFHFKLDLSPVTLLFEGRAPLWARLMYQVQLIGGVAIILATLMMKFPARAVAMLATVVLAFLPMIWTLATSDQTSFVPRTPKASTSYLEAVTGVIMLLGIFATLVGARVRFFRPNSRFAYMASTIGGACLLVLLLIPMGPNGEPMLVAPFQLMKQHLFQSILLLLVFCGVLASGVVSVLNGMSKPNRAASRQAQLAFWLFVSPILLAALVNSLDQARMAFKFTPAGAWEAFRVLVLDVMTKCITAAIILLIPVALTDLLIGRTPEPHECVVCGYDLRASGGRACPECGFAG